MEAKKSLRRVARRQFTKTVKIIEARGGFTPDSELDFTLLSEMAGKLEQLNNQIEELMSAESDEAALEKEFEEVISYRKTWLALKLQYKNIKNDRNPTCVQEKAENKRNYKLPILEMKKFDGDVRNWLPFWGQFQKIHEDKLMDDSDKFQYLVQAMTPETEVRKFIESFPATKDSYRQALEDLKKRYAREELLIQVYVRELLTLILKKEENKGLAHMYDQLSTQLRALETLGVTRDGYSSFILPMVESALPVEVLRAWERARPADRRDELRLLLEFLKREVESDQRINMATEFSQSKETILSKEATASTLVAKVEKPQVKLLCIWCDKNHSSIECFKLAKMSLEQRRQHLNKKKACTLCLKIGHHAKVCRGFTQCFMCQKRHSPVLCPGQDNTTKSNKEEPTGQCTSNNFTAQANSVTLLQTTMVKIINGNKEMTVRALIDNGSQRSYLRRDVAQKLSIERSGIETLSHALFGGVQVKSKDHDIYNIKVKSCDNLFKLNITALEQSVICNNLPSYHNTDVKLNNLLMKHNILLYDDDCTEISLLIGADYSGYIITNTIVVLTEGLVAIKTKLGWVIQGKVPNKNKFLTNMLFCSADITGFWSLELLGIRDPVENKSKLQAEAEAVMAFEDSVTINSEGRYEVSLPLEVGYEELLSNRGLAERRLIATTKRLVSSSKYTEYNNIIVNWERDGIVEKVPIGENKLNTHYLPHRGVVKDNSLTTKLRPVFDASACDKNSRSLNSYLNKGINYLDKIPHILTGFRKGAIGISADIAKAFLQVSIRPIDRDFLRFLWWENDMQKNMVEYRHCRVVFGLTSSPFLLSATISHHLNQVTGKEQNSVKILAKSFYVDNCLTSLDTKEETSKFISESKEVMSQAKFDLRQWVTSLPYINETGKKTISVLGLLWDTVTDELCCNIDNLPTTVGREITKKELMSLIQKIFDPVGFTCPATLTPRLIMQETWRRSLSWDDKLPEDLLAEFRKWYEHITYLQQCKIPRRLTKYFMVTCSVSLHMFCDSSKIAYGACVLLRSEKEGKVHVQMLSAKARVAPPERVSIPKLELTAALMGSRLLAEAKKSLGVEIKEEYCWTDSCVAFYWVTRNIPWNVYVHNRVKEIRENSNPSNWHHIPGTLNWADIASRGCNAKELLSLRWWEGPAWLRLRQEEWPKSSVHVDTTEACKELRKTKTVCNTNLISVKEGIERLCYFSKYTKIVRMMAWILRFKNNTLHKDSKKKGDITVEEYEGAEKKIIKLIQIIEREYITEQKRNLGTYHDDEDGLLRIKTKLLNSDIQEATKFPILLPAKNMIVRRLVEQRHVELKHAGANQLTADIRTRFWIIGIRRLAKSVIAACTICTRFRAKKAEAPTAPLPSERIECTAPFQVSGVDLAGPLLLKDGEKCWVVLYTCAVYRCVHLELTKSLSTEAFILTLRRFIARRGRIKQIISDNGTNFQGTKNKLAELDWEEVQKQSTIDRIKWKMNAPTAAWWGGFFERLIRIMKELLKRILGQSCVNYEEMETILCECEAVMNQRPLTYVQDDKNNSLEPLTPACFLQCIPQNDMTDLDAIDAKTLNMRLKFILKLKEDFKQRFKTEYLTALVQRGKDKITNLCIGDVVLIETDDKRLKWPLGVIEEIYPGKDGVGRTAKVKTALGFKIRPFQRLYPLEVSSRQESTDNFPCSGNIQTAAEDEQVEEVSINDRFKDITTIKKTRSGRAIKMPSKYTI